MRNLRASAGLACIAILAFILSGCAHLDVQQTYRDPLTGIVYTNRARATFWFRKDDWSKVDVVVQNKSGTKLIGAAGIQSSVDSTAVRETWKGLGEAIGEGARASMGLPPVPPLLLP